MLPNAKQQNLLIWQGDDFSLSLDLAPEYSDLSGYQLRAQIRDSWEDNAALLATLAVTPLTGANVRINLLKLNSSALPATCTPAEIPKKDIATFPAAKLPEGAIVWDLQLTDSNGVTTTVRWGYVLVVREVTIEGSIPAPPPAIDPTNPYPQYLTQDEGDGRYAMAGGAAAAREVLTYSPSNSYNLQDQPPNPAKALLFVNGAKQSYGADFAINNTVLTWTSTNLSLSATDTIEIYY